MPSETELNKDYDNLFKISDSQLDKDYNALFQGKDMGPAFTDQASIDKFKGETADAFFKDTTPGRLLWAFGQGAAQGWGAGNDPKLRDKLTDVDAQQDWGAIHKGVSKGLNEVFLRPLATTFDAAWRYGSGALGGAFGAGMGLTGQVGQELTKTSQRSQLPVNQFIFGAVGEVVSSLVPSEDVYTNPYTGQQTASGTWGFLPEGMLPPKPFTTRAIEARAKGIVGEGEEGYFHTKDIAPEDLLERREAAQQSGVPFEMPPQKPTWNIEDLAREIDPDTFNKLDSLREKQEALRASAEHLQSQTIVVGKMSREEYLRNQEISKSLAQNVQDLQDVDVQMRDLIPAQAKARQTVQEYLTSDSPEAEIYRQYVQAKLLENELAQEGRLAAQHADTLLEKGTPEEAAEIVLKDQKSENEPKVPGESGSADIKNDKEVAAAKQQLGVTSLYRGEPAEGSLESGVSYDSRERGRWYSHSEETARAYAGEGGKVHRIDIPTSELEGVTEKYRAESNGEERLIRQEFFNKATADIGTGPSHTMGVAQSMEDWAKSQDLAETFDLPEIKALNIKEQKTKIASLVDADPQRAVRIAMGTEDVPEGFSGHMILNAVEFYAQKRQDVDLLRRLAINSPFVREYSEAGRTLRVAQERSNLDINAMDRLQEIIDFRKKRQQGNVTNEAFKFGETLKTYMEKAASSVDEAIEYIRSIECDY